MVFSKSEARPGLKSETASQNFFISIYIQYSISYLENPVSLDSRRQFPTQETKTKIMNETNAEETDSVTEETLSVQLWV